MEHTPEPWARRGASVGIIGGDGVLIMTARALTGPSTNDNEQQANAARIVACVNFCKGFTNEQLTEPGLVIYEP